MMLSLAIRCVVAQIFADATRAKSETKPAEAARPMDFAPCIRLPRNLQGAARCQGLTQGLPEAPGGLEQLALEDLDLFGDVMELFFGEHAGLCDLLGFAIRLAHCRSNADRNSSEPALLGHFDPPYSIREELILYPKCPIEPSKSQIAVRGI